MKRTCIQSTPALNADMNSIKMNTTGKDFSFDAVNDFDQHIEQSIPNYGHINELVLLISSYFVKSGHNVYDIGCSTGSLLRKLSELHTDKQAGFFGYDISANLLPASSGRLNFINQDITKSEVYFNNAQLILSIFTLQFVNVNDRIRLLSKIYQSLNKGGAFIICEKVYSNSGLIQDIFSFTHYDMKAKSFNQDDILGKQQKLREIMMPLSAEENVETFKEAGFKTMDQFFQSLNFRGWILIK